MQVDSVAIYMGDYLSTELAVALASHYLLMTMIITDHAIQAIRALDQRLSKHSAIVPSTT